MEEINSELANPFKNTNRAEREQAKTAPQIYWRAVFSAFALSPLGLGKAQCTHVHWASLEHLGIQKIIGRALRSRFAFSF